MEVVGRVVAAFLRKQLDLGGRKAAAAALRPVLRPSFSSLTLPPLLQCVLLAGIHSLSVVPILPDC